MKKYRASFYRIIGVCLLLFFSTILKAQTPNEYTVKATFLFNFTQFVEWPANTFSSAEAPFVIGILGDDPFRSIIDETVAEKKVKEHAVTVERYQNVKDIKNCQILYISNSEMGRLKETLQTLPVKGILTVSDMADFTNAGGIIRFISRKNRIKLQINLPASKAADLVISPQLLEVADVVR